jgi:hypothetical protein
MLRSAAVALLAASAVTAQPELTAENGNLMVRSVSEVDLGNIQAQLASTTYAATNDATARMFDAMSQMGRDNQVAMNGLQSTIDAAMLNLNSQMASQSAAMSAAIASSNADMSTRMAAQTSTIASQVDSVNTQISAATAAAISRSTSDAAATTAAIRAMNVSLTSAMANKASQDKHFWLGGCASHNHGCWQDFCLSRVEIDKARPYFYKRTNTRMRALRAGMFRMQAYFMGTRNYMHVSVFINGRRKRYTHYHTWHGWWKSDYSDHTFYIAANQDFWFQGCGHFHNAGGEYHYQRQEFMWYGKRPN